MKTVGERLRAARENKNLKQTQVKERTGINNKTLSGYENNVSQPDFDTLKVLADLYEVSTDWLLGLTTNKVPKKVEGEYTPAEENEYERLLRETEEKYNVNLRDDPVALRLYQELLVGIAKTKLDNK